jgi:hypothetical protein
MFKPERINSKRGPSYLPLPHPFRSEIKNTAVSK